MRARLDVPDEHDFGNEKMIATAEHHARLLQAVWEWANDEPTASSDLLIASITDQCKTRIRSLLQPTEETNSKALPSPREER